ncbi:hypothetical protein KC19_3G160000 [Ceratodon purpureus]|uniref:Methyltransferase type 11 domain-containing protein n=1 Tax=Ceratodon purpureus TaxID=3225 RepID=A0A8T0ILF6_CERPU|nr:hypothetical protein KC19_3G160000 [Ceratodon purpureus]
MATSMAFTSPLALNFPRSSSNTLPSCSASLLNAFHVSTHLQRLPFFTSPTLAAYPERMMFATGRFACGSPRIAPNSASVQHHQEQSVCTCCTRRAVLTSLGGAIVANVTAERTSLAVEGSIPSADMIREAVYPARPEWYEEYFATSMNTTMRSYEAEIAGYKRELFSRLGDNVKTILELGIGTGPNLAYYGGRPSITSVIGVDPNVKMARYAEAAAVAAGLSPAQFKFMPAVGEGLPLPSASVDAVICTLVLCSVSDVSSTLKEVQRVLRPGGMFLFVEHVAAPEGDSLRFWQGLLDPVQQLVADGCHLKRDTLGFIEAAQFASVDARRVTVNGASLIGPHVVGSACIA